MGNAQAVGNICRTCLTRGGQQISDELNIILKQSCGLSRTSLAEAMRLGELGGELCQRCGSFSITVRDIAVSFGSPASI